MSIVSENFIDLLSVLIVVFIFREIMTYKDFRPLRYLLTPLVTLLIAGFVLLAIAENGFSQYRLLVLLGLIVSAVADSILMIKEVDLNSSNVIQFLHPYGTWMVNLIDKFITITAFSYSLDLFALAFIIFIIGWRNGGKNVRAGFITAAIAAGTILFHVITGSVLILTLVGSAILAFIINRFLIKEKGKEFLTATAPISAVAAGLLCFRYVHSLTGGNTSPGGSIHSMLHIGLKNAATIILPLLILYCPAKKAVVKIFRDEWRNFEPYVLWLIPLLVINIFVDLPTVNDSKFIFPLFIILLPPIVWEAIDIIRKSRKTRRILLIGWTFILFFTPPILTVRGFLMDRPVNPIEKRRFIVSNEERALYSWLRENTEIDAVIMENNIDCLMPVFAHRRSFFPPPSAINVNGYRGEKINLYRRIKEKVFSNEPLSIDTIKEIASLKNDVYIVIWPSDVEKNPFLKEKFTPYSNLIKKVYSSNGITVYRVEKSKGR